VKTLLEKGNAAQNYSLLLKMALNLLKNEKTEKEVLKEKD
jgi:predicted transposase YbfD/YdcC